MITDPDELSHWFPSSVRAELRVGGSIEFSGDPNLEQSSGTVLVCDPPHRFGYTWNDDELHFELTPAGDGCTLTLVNVLEARDTAARNAAGWTVCLAELERRLTGATAHGPHSDTAESWRPIYDDYVAGGMPYGAAIPGESHSTR